MHVSLCFIKVLAVFTTGSEPSSSDDDESSTTSVESVAFAPGYVHVHVHVCVTDATGYIIAIIVSSVPLLPW